MEIPVSVPKWYHKLKDWVGEIFPWFPVASSTFILFWLIEAIQFPLSSTCDGVTGGHFAGEKVKEVICKGESACRPDNVC